MQNPVVGRIFLGRGNYSLDGSTLMLSGGNAELPSLIVGRAAADSAFLTFFVGNASTTGTVVGEASNTVGRLTVDGQTVWANEFGLVVGGAGVGVLDLMEGTTTTTQQLIVAESAGSEGDLLMMFEGTATGIEEHLMVTDSTTLGMGGTATAMIQNANLNTGRTVLGDLAGSMATVTLLESENFVRWEYEEELTVGRLGTGSIVASDQVVISAPMDTPTPVYIAREAGSVGTVSLQGSLSLLETEGAAINIGLNGNGALVLEQGAYLGTGFLNVGPFEDPDEGAPRVLGSTPKTMCRRLWWTRN